MAKILKNAYARFNKWYFSGALPDIPVRWSDKLDKDAYGWYTGVGAAPEDGEILISTEIKRTQCLWQMTLLHEMCHVKLRDEPEEILSTNKKHSKVWVKEMRRLAAAGAFDRLWSWIIVLVPVSLAGYL